MYQAREDLTERGTLVQISEKVKLILVAKKEREREREREREIRLAEIVIPRETESHTA